MKKLFSMMAVLAAMFAFVACEPTSVDPGPDTPTDKQKLDTPELSVDKTETSFTITWNPVTNAEAYIVKMEGGAQDNTTECKYTFSNLNAGKYTVRVIATANGYKNSDVAKVDVEIAGLSEAAWFTLSLELLEEPYPTEDYTFTDYNSVVACMSGENVASIVYQVFDAASLEGVTKAEIKEAVKAEGYDVSAQALQAINAGDVYNPIIGGCLGSTDYVCYALATNTEGVEYLANSTIKTAEAELTDALKRWVGTYSAQTSKMVNIDTDPIKITDQVTNFTFTVTATPGTTDQVDVYGLSCLSADLPAYGYVVSAEGIDYLCILACQAVADLGDGYVAMWFPFCQKGNGYTFVTGEFIAYAFAMDAEGKITYQAGGGQLSDGSDFTVLAMDFLAYNGQNIGTLGREDGSDFVDWKCGDITNVTKVDAAAKVAGKSAMNYTVNEFLVEPSLVF